MRDIDADGAGGLMLLKLAFARGCILRQFLTLIVQLYFSLSLTVFTFSSREKVTKSARQRTESVICSFCSRVVLQHRSAVTNLPSNTFIKFLGGAELPQLATL